MKYTLPFVSKKISGSIPGAPSIIWGSDHGPDGSFAVINNHGFELNGSGVYEVKMGPSTRRVIDFSNVENSVAIIPTGQSGNIFSKHYKNQSNAFLKGDFVKMMINKQEIELSKDKLKLKPSP